MTEEFTEDTELALAEGDVQGTDDVEEGEAIESTEPVRPPNPNLRWYVVNTFSSYENRAKASLEERIRQENLEEFFGFALSFRLDGHVDGACFASSLLAVESEGRELVVLEDVPDSAVRVGD